MIKRVLTVVALIAGGLIYAQDGTSSPYSYYGIGELKFKGTIENQSMGGLSIFTDSIHLNLQNPAAYADLKLTTYTGGLTHNVTRFNTTETKETKETTSFDYLAIGIPVSQKAAIGFGVLPYTAVGYGLETLQNEAAGLTATRYSGEGGINRVFFSMGYALNKSFSVGVTGNYDFGNVLNETIKSVENVQLATQEINRSDLSGFDFNFALNFKQPINNKLTLRSTVTFSPEAKLNSENRRTFSTVQLLDNGAIFPRDIQEVDLEAVGLKETELTLPMNTSFGLGVGQERKWFFGAEYKFKEISKFDNPFIQVENINYKDGYTFSAGGYFIPKYNSFNSYWSRVVYRAGVRLDNTGLEIEGEPINNFGISFGVGLPVAGFSNANLGFEIGRRGTTEKNLIREDYFNVRISLSFNDKWFLKRKFD